MSVSEPLNLGDKLRAALREAQQVLESTDLRGKVKLDVQADGGSPGLSGVEASMDRTEADAKKAAGGGGDGGSAGVGVVEGPLSPSNKLIDAMGKLIDALNGVPDALDKSGTRPRRRRMSSSLDEDESPAPNYMNPYILQGLVQNPLGTMRGMGTSMMMGGAGMGMKPPGWLSQTLGGSSGEFSVGRALGAETLGGEVGASAYMAPGAIAAAGVGTFIASMVATFQIEQHLAGARARDAAGRIEDTRFGNAAGIDWRGSAWKDFNQSRNDIDVGDIRSFIQGAGVSFGGMTRRGNQEMMGGFDTGGGDGLQSAVNTALRIGVSSGQLGGVFGAATRSGTLDMNAGNGMEQMIRYLGLIEQWTSKAKDYGLSTSEALSAMASDNQAQAASSHGLVTDAASRQMLSLRSNLAMGGMDRPGVQSMADALGAPPHSDMERVMEMNQFLGNDEKLSPQGRQWAVAALGAKRVVAMEKEYGNAAGTMIPGNGPALPQRPCNVT